MVCKTIPCVSADFLTQAERNRAIDATSEGACTRHGLSVFSTYASCEHQQRAFSRLGRYIVRARLSAEHGMLAETPSTRNPRHHTWWPYLGVQREALFAAHEEQGGVG
jgi:hypothetical protein